MFNIIDIFRGTIIGHYAFCPIDLTQGGVSICVNDRQKLILIEAEAVLAAVVWGLKLMIEYLKNACFISKMTKTLMNFNVNLLSDEETEGNIPFSIELLTSVRATVISRLDNFSKHHKSVSASIIYFFGSSLLSLESILQIDNVIRHNKAWTCSMVQTIELN